MTDKKSIKPVEPSKRPGTPIPKCFDERAIRSGRDSKCGQFLSHKISPKNKTERKK